MKFFSLFFALIFLSVTSQGQSVCSDLFAVAEAPPFQNIKEERLFLVDQVLQQPTLLQTSLLLQSLFKFQGYVVDRARPTTVLRVERGNLAPDFNWFQLELRDDRFLEGGKLKKQKFSLPLAEEEYFSIISATFKDYALTLLIERDPEGQDYDQSPRYEKIEILLNPSAQVTGIKISSGQTKMLEFFWSSLQITLPYRIEGRRIFAIPGIRFFEVPLEDR